MDIRESDQLLSIPGLAAFLDVSVQTVYKWRTNGTGPRGIRVGRHIRFRRQDVDRWLESQADNPQPAA